MNFFKRKPSLLSIILYFVQFGTISFCKPLPIIPVEDTHNSETPGASKLIHFLKKFGYLQTNNLNITGESQSQLDHEMLYTKEGIEEAIKRMQKFGALPETGKLDNITLSLLTRPRCGVPDVGKPEFTGHRTKRYVIGSNGWNKRLITYRVENWADQLDEETVLSDMRKAFAAWADYARLHFINKPRTSQDDVDISISFGRGYHGDTYPFDGSGGVLAHAFFPQSHGSLGGDLHFDLDEAWTSSKRKNSHFEKVSGYNVSFLAVAVHEIGHSLGLSHSPSQDSVMFPYYQGFEQENHENVRLGYDDIMAMYRLYIQREIQDTGYVDDTFTTSTTEYPTQTTTIRYYITTLTNAPTSTSLRTTDRENVPNLCNDEFDTISFIRNEIFVFKGKYMWRFKNRGITEHFYPVKTARLFPMLVNAAKVDAAFENNEGKLVFLSGKNYWMYDNGESSGPFPLTNFDLPKSLEKVDAAFIWGKNKKLYFFSNNLFWKYNTTSERMVEGYPKGIERWRGLPNSGIKAAMRWSDGITYFFKNDEFWRFDDTKVQTENSAMKTSSYWFGC